MARASNTTGGYGSNTTLMLGTPPRCDNTLKTPQNPPEGLVLKGASFPGSIPHSPNYFDALSEMEEDAPLVEMTPLGAKPMETQRTSAPSKDPNKKVPMHVEQHEREAEEDALQLALHRSRVEAHRTRLTGSRKAH